MRAMWSPAMELDCVTVLGVPLQEQSITCKIYSNILLFWYILSVNNTLQTKDSKGGQLKKIQLTMTEVEEAFKMSEFDCKITMTTATKLCFTTSYVQSWVPY